MTEETEREQLEGRVDQGDNAQLEQIQYGENQAIEAQQVVKAEEQEEVQELPSLQVPDLEPLGAPPAPSSASASMPSDISSSAPSSARPSYSLAPMYGAYDSSAQAQETQSHQHQELQPTQPLHQIQDQVAQSQSQLQQEETSARQDFQHQQSQAQPQLQQAPSRPIPQYGQLAPESSEVEPSSVELSSLKPSTPYGVRQEEEGLQEENEPSHPFLRQSSLPKFPFGEEFGRNKGDRGNKWSGIHGGNGENSGNGTFSPATDSRSASRSKASKSSIVLTAFIASLLSAGLCLGVGYIAIERGWLTPVASVPLDSIKSNNTSSGSAKVLTTNSVDWTDVAKTVSPSVVSIQVKTRNAELAGSGAIVDNQGHIVTNNHVVAGARQILVTLANGQIYSAKIVGTDPTTDLAVIVLVNAPKDLTVATFANSDELAVGEPVLAIGNPLGYDDSATSGIISALNRPVSVMDRSRRQQVVTNAIQVDAAINPGNSGGPTFNAAGQVVGINSSIASRSTSERTAGSIGIGFAIPANLVTRVVKDIIANGRVDHVMLGVIIQSVTVEVDGVTRAGAQIVNNSASTDPAVVDGSPAAKAGLKAGDIIVGFDGKPVSNNFSLLGYVRAAALNQTVVLTVVRDGRVIQVQVLLDTKEISRQSERDSFNRRERDPRGERDRDQRNQRDPRDQRSPRDRDDDRQDGGQREINPYLRGDQDDDGSEDPDTQLFDPFGLW